MTKTTFLVNVEAPEIRIAEMHDGRLFALDIDRGGRLLGDIFKGRVENVLPGMDAAFINIGLSRNALVYAGDIFAADSIEKPISTSIESAVHVGNELIVQIARPPVGSKGARVTTRLSLPGRYIVLVANSDTVGVSRRLENEDERQRLRRIAEKLRPLDHGLIVRTEAEGIGESDLAADVSNVVRQLHDIRHRAVGAKVPTSLHKDLGVLGRLARDRMNSDVDAVIFDSTEVFDMFRQVIKESLPEVFERVRMHEQPTSLFKTFNIESEIERATDRFVALPHGGGLVIDETEALTAIDVNTGKFVGRTRLADTVLQTNLEAVEEAARQIRIRDLGGVIVVDFIDMDRTRDRIKVLNALEAALKFDRARTRIVQLSPTGLVEMTRRREGNSLRQLLHRSCPYCAGDGMIKSPHTVALQTRRQLRELAAASQPEAILVTVHPETAAAFVSADEDVIAELEKSTRARIYVQVDFGLHLEASRIVSCEGHEISTHAAPIEKGERFQLPPHVPFYPQKEPQFLVLQGKLVQIENLASFKTEGETPSLNTPITIEILEAGRWFHCARIIETRTLA